MSLNATGAPSSSVLFLTDGDVRAVFDWRAAIDALREAYSETMIDAMSPPRTMARGKGAWLRTMSGIAPRQKLMGSKSIAVSLVERRASYLISLFDTETAALCALMDGNAVTGFRTAATSALAIDVLAPNTALRVALIGSGFEASHHVHAVAAVRAIREVHVYSPNPESRARFASAHAAPERISRAHATAAEAVWDADLIICAARSRDESPTLQAAWLSRDALIVSIGSTVPEQREVDAGVIARADLIVADVLDEVVDETGDMIAARAAGIPFAGKTVSLADLVAGRVDLGRRFGTMLYKSAGTALQDLTVAGMCYQRAHDAGTGMRLSGAVVPVQK
jgi:alanine dehydrogenase